MTAETPVRAGVVEAVTFDFWNTLCFEPDLDQRREMVAEAFCVLLAEIGRSVEPADVAAAYDAAREEYWTAWHDNRQFTGADAARQVFERLGCQTDSALCCRLAQEFDACSERAEVNLVDGVGDVIEELRRRDVRIGIVCDVGLMASPFLRGHLRRHGLLDAFDHWSFSDEVGVYKPHPRIFRHALAGLGGVPPERAAHVGDRRRTDIAGAQGVGMLAVRLTTVFDDADPDQGPSGDAVIESYDRLLDALGLDA